MMLTVQMMSGSVEPDRRNGSSQSRYQGYTTGAHKGMPPSARQMPRETSPKMLLAALAGQSRRLSLLAFSQVVAFPM